MSHTYLDAWQNVSPELPVQMARNVWWVGHYLPGDPFQCHAYLIDLGNQSILVDPGSVLTFAHTLKKINTVTDFANIRYFLCQHQDPDITGSLPTIDRMVTREDACVISHWRANVLLKHLGLKMPLLCIEKHFDWKLALADCFLQFVFTPYLHFPGAFCTYERQSQILFSSDLFGGFTDGWSLVAKDESYFESIRPFHEHYMPHRDILLHALLKLECLDIGMIAPQHGSIIPRHLVHNTIHRLKGLECGLFLAAKEHTDWVRLTALRQVLREIQQAMLIHRDFRDIVQALLNVIRPLLPVQAMEFYTMRENGQGLRLASRNGYQGEIVLLSMALIKIFALDREAWLATYSSHFIHFSASGDDADPVGPCLLIPLFAPGQEWSSALFFLHLEAEREITADAQEIIEQLAFVLQVAVDRKHMEEELVKALSIAEASAKENIALNSDLQHALFEQKNANEGLNRANRFIRKTFGRYMSDEVVASILDRPEGLRLGGEDKEVTVMMTDLRGFTAMGERLSPENVISMLNIYLEQMTEIILKYNGTIIEFLGDGILALFGAPVTREDDVQRAVACALEMQLAIPRVNAKNRERHFPEVAMGIGINSGRVVAGNIGSDLRSKYGVVGKVINMTARIESLSIGGQVLISASTLAGCDGLARVDDQWQVSLKGIPHPVTIYHVGGIYGRYWLELPRSKPVPMQPVTSGATLILEVLAGKKAGGQRHTTKICALGQQTVEVTPALEVERFTNFKIELCDNTGKCISDQIYGKAMSADPEKNSLRIHITSMPTEVEAFFGT